MGTCRFCGQSAGLFRSEHAECVAKHEAEKAEAERKQLADRWALRQQVLTAFDQVYETGAEMPTWPGGVPSINLVGGERVVWLFENVEYLADKKKRSYNGVYGGPSVHVMRGVSVRLGILHGAPHTAVERISQGVGSLILTTSNIYFYSERASVRIPYKKVTSYLPYEDGVGIIKDSATALPLAFVTGSDLAFEVVSRISRIALNPGPHAAKAAALSQATSVQAAAEGDEPPSGALYTKAVQIVIASQRASISGVQRHLRIGYNLAAQLIARMEKEGIVGAPQSDGSRRVLVGQPH